MQKFTFNLKKAFCITFAAAVMVSFGFSLPDDSRIFIHTFLNKYYDKDGQKEALKRYELNVTNTGFCRYRRVFANGKEEFFSFNLSRFKSMDYYGDVNAGTLYLRTKNDDVIVQTRKDKAGDVDSMSTYMSVPLKNIDVEELNELYNRIVKLTASNLVATH